MSEHGRVPVKLCLQRPVAGSLWPVGLLYQPPGEWKEWLHKENVSVYSLLLFAVVMFCKVTIDTELVGSEPLLLREIQG